MELTLKQILECNTGLSSLLKIKAGKLSYRFGKLARQLEPFVEGYKTGDQSIIDKYKEEKKDAEGKGTGDFIILGTHLDAVNKERKEMLAKVEDVPSVEVYKVTKADLKDRDDKPIPVSGEEMLLTDCLFDWSES